MPHLFRHRWGRIGVLTAAVFVLVILGFGIYLGSMAGALPWQAEPTRIPITPFAGIPGFDAPAQAPASPTPAPATSGQNVPAPDAAGQMTVVAVSRDAGVAFAWPVAS